MRIVVAYRRRRAFDGPMGRAICHIASCEAGGHRFSVSEYVVGKVVFDVEDFKRRAVEYIERTMRDMGVEP